MSGYASKAEVREVTEASLRVEGRDPADYNVTGIMRDAFYYRGPGYGWGAQDEATWRAAVERHRTAAGAERETAAAIAAIADPPGPGDPDYEPFDPQQHRAALAALAEARGDNPGRAGGKQR